MLPCYIPLIKPKVDQVVCANLAIENRGLNLYYSVLFEVRLQTFPGPAPNGNVHLETMGTCGIYYAETVYRAALMFIMFICKKSFEKLSTSACSSTSSSGLHDGWLRQSLEQSGLPAQRFKSLLSSRSGRKNQVGKPWENRGKNHGNNHGTWTNTLLSSLPFTSEILENSPVSGPVPRDPML